MKDTERCCVIVKLQVEGTHRWKDCNIEEVSFLRDFHRHIFYITCKKQVTDDDRQVEIICMKREIQKYLFTTYGNSPCQFGGRSCEMLARELAKKFELTYCSVLEDGENGAEITVDKD